MGFNYICSVHNNMAELLHPLDVYTNLNNMKKKMNIADFQSINDVRFGAAVISREKLRSITGGLADGGGGTVYTDCGTKQANGYCDSGTDTPIVHP